MIYSSRIALSSFAARRAYSVGPNKGLQSTRNPTPTEQIVSTERETRSEATKGPAHVQGVSNPTTEKMESEASPHAGLPPSLEKLTDPNAGAKVDAAERAKGNEPQNTQSKGGRDIHGGPFSG